MAGGRDEATPMGGKRTPGTPATVFLSSLASPLSSSSSLSPPKLASKDPYLPPAGAFVPDAPVGYAAVC
jgi:hypothetical protein